jgi:hypothetical protein
MSNLKRLVLLKQFDFLRKVGVVDRLVVGLQLPLLLLDPGELFSGILRMRIFLLTNYCAGFFIIYYLRT